MIYRRRRFHRRYGRGKKQSFRYVPITYYSHRFRNSHGICAGAGFYDTIDAKNEVCTSRAKGKARCVSLTTNSYQNDSLDFTSPFASSFAPTNKEAVGAPYYQFSEELVSLLQRYSKYKLVAVKKYMKNMRFLQVTVRAKTGDVTQDDRLNIQRYFLQKYGDDSSGKIIYSKDFVVPYDKFEIFYQYVPNMRIDYLYRNHTCFEDTAIINNDVRYGVGDAPTKSRLCTQKSILKEHYYPKCTTYCDSQYFWSNHYRNGSFKAWLDAMGVRNYPNILYVRPAIGPDQYISADINTAFFNVIFYDEVVYYRFKFAGMNNADVQ